MKTITTLLFQVIICSFLSSQGATLLLDHNDSQYNSITDPFQGGTNAEDGLLYYLATSPDNNNHSIYSTDGTVEGTVKRYNYTSFGSKLTRMEVVDNVIYAINNSKVLYSVTDGVIENQKTFSGQISGIYPYNKGVLVYETMGNNQRLWFVNALDAVINNLGSFNTYNRIIPSNAGGLFLGSDTSSSSENTTERVIITDGTSENTMLLKEYLALQGIGNFHSIKSAVAAGDYILINAKTSSGSFDNQYIVNLVTKKLHTPYISGIFIDARMLNDHFIMRTYEMILSYDPALGTTVIIENDETSDAPLVIVDNLLYYLTENDTTFMSSIYTTDGTLDSRQSFNSMLTVGTLHVEKLGQDYAVILSDMNFKKNVDIYRTAVDTIENVTNLVSSGADLIMMKVKGNLIFNKYTPEYGLELYRSDAIVDNDEDGYLSDVDCDESNPEINPDAIEDDSNDIDENCDGILTGVAPTDLGDKINVYPNPASSQMIIEGIDFLKHTLYLRNTDGRRLMQIKSNITDISDLVSGLYLLEFRNTEDNTSIYKNLMKL